MPDIWERAGHYKQERDEARAEVERVRKECLDLIDGYCLARDRALSEVERLRVRVSAQEAALVTIANQTSLKAAVRLARSFVPSPSSREDEQHV